MGHSKWEKIERLFEAALIRPRGERTAFLSAECGPDDDVVKRVVESLLEQSARGETMLNSSIVADVARALAANEESAASNADSTTMTHPDVPEIDKARRAADPNDGSGFGLLASLDRAEFAPGTTLGGRYRIVSLIGRGGMGEVYRAEDLKLEQSIALKFLPRHLSDDAARVEQFVREVGIGRQISHPNVVRIYDIGEIGGRHYLSMEYVAGEDLQSLLRRVGRLSSEKGLEIAGQLCAGLAAAHAKGVLHCDLKPANVMIDARGRARITDFGLAIAISRVGAARIAGTPAYMAPEQLIGGRLAVQTDLFALGLILYELLTGKRLYAVTTLEQRWRMEREVWPVPASIDNWELDPAVARVIRECLQKPLENRPSSALSVAAALPGGDPLAAALAAGAVPSADVVAAAGEKVGMRPLAAWICVISALVGLGVVVSQSDRILIARQPRLTTPPEVLVNRARTVLTTFGYEGRRADTAYWFVLHTGYWDLVQARDAPIERLQWLKDQTTKGLLFVYRQSPRALVPLNLFGVVSYRDPPAEVPGMVDVSLDSDGRLVRFTAVPLAGPDPERPSGDFRWSQAFAEAGLDFLSFEPVASSWMPPFAHDTRTAWRPRVDDPPETQMIVAVAALRDRPVYFSVERSSLSSLAPLEIPDERGLAGVESVLFGLTAAALIGAILLAYRNVRLERWDREGTVRLAGYFFVGVALSVVFRADHIARLPDEYMLMARLVGFALYAAAFLAVVYVALEPFVRRRWPDMLTSWTRILAGRFRDPLVGRDILIGALGGLAVIALRELEPVLAQWLGVPAPMPYSWSLEGLRGPRHFVALFLFVHNQAVGFGLGGLFLLLLLRILLRKQWLAVTALGLLTVPILIRSDYQLWLAIAMAGLASAITVATLIRFGVVALISNLFFSFAIERMPITLDTADFYFGRSMVTLLILVLLIVFAFRCTLAGRPLVTPRLLKD